MTKSVISFHVTNNFGSSPGAFKLYDLDADGYITRSEMLLILEAIELMLGNQEPNNNSADKKLDPTSNEESSIVRTTDNNHINITGPSSANSAETSRRTSTTQSSKERIDEIFQKLDRVSCLCWSNLVDFNMFLTLFAAEQRQSSVIRGVHAGHERPFDHQSTLHEQFDLTNVWMNQIPHCSSTFSKPNLNPQTHKSDFYR